MTDIRTFKLGQLPFVSDSGEEIDYWAVTPSGNANQDYQTGLQYGREAVQYMDYPGDSTDLIVYIVDDMIKQGQFRPLEIGFFRAVARPALYYHNSLRMGVLVPGCFGDLWPRNVKPSDRLHPRESIQNSVSRV